MAYRFEAYTSRGRYNAAYDELNEQIYLGFSCKVVAGARHDDEGGYGRVLYVTASKPITRPQAEMSFIKEFRRECSCEHDCCGHANGGVVTGKIKSNRRGTRWVVPTYYAYNI